jgi:allantoinase
MSVELVVRSERVVTPDGVRRASIYISGEKIIAVENWESVPASCPLHDVGRAVVMAGLVDTHVHINEPGRTDWEGFQSATRAAAAGGTTTLIDMPLNNIPATTTVPALEEKRRAARGQCWVDVGFWGGVVPGNAGDLRPLREAGVFGFKCFLVPSGVAEFAHVAESDLREALPILASLGVPLLAHAESPRPIEAAMRRLRDEDPRRYRTWLRSRPPQAERDAIALLVALSREFRAPVHIVHLSAAMALPILRRARREGVAITVETCPHYLYFRSGSVPAGAVQFKCAPPIRDSANRDVLWRALQKGLIDFIVTDHSPCPANLKADAHGDFFKAWGGIASLELRLPVVWTAVRARRLGVEAVARWLAEAPARMAGLGGRKGTLTAGADADLVVWDPGKTFHVKQSNLQHKNKLTPYDGKTLAGVVQATYLRGNLIFERGRFAGDARGSLLEPMAH